MVRYKNIGGNSGQHMRLVKARSQSILMMVRPTFTTTRALVLPI